jgi:hypothetical protein
MEHYIKNLTSHTRELFDYYNEFMKYTKTLNNHLINIKKYIDTLHTYLYGNSGALLECNMTDNQLKQIYAEDTLNEINDEMIKYKADYLSAFKLYNKFVNDYRDEPDFIKYYNENAAYFDCQIGPNYLNEEERYLTTDYNDYDDMINYTDKMDEYLKDQTQTTFLNGGLEWGMKLIFIIFVILIVIIIITIIIIRKQKILIN